MIQLTHNPSQNQLIGALPKEEFERLSPYLQLAPLALGAVLYEPGGRQQQAYFPTTAIVSLHYVTEAGASSELAGIGHEGMVGTAILMGGQSNASAAMVHTAGYAYRLDRQALMQEFERGGALQKLMLRYTQALMTQISQTAVCNRHHTLEQQLCRWLLSALDRVPTGELTMTQELVANMIGVRREGITEAAGRLQVEGFIRYRRGHITVLDRQGLEGRVCECYGVLRREFTRLLPQTHPRPGDS